MILSTNSDYEIKGDTIIEVSELEELSEELIDSFIDKQIEEPYDFRSNFVESFTEEYEKLVIVNDDNDEYVAELQASAKEFYLHIIQKINKRFNLGIDMEVIEDVDFNGVQNICEAIYEFFVVDYTHNVSTFLYRMIINNKDAIRDELQTNEEVQDVSTVGQIEKLGDTSYAIIMANINTAISIAKGIDIDILDFIQLYNEDEFDTSVIRMCIIENIINGDFIKSFVGDIFNGVQDYVYDTIVSNIQESILYQITLELE